MNQTKLKTFPGRRTLCILDGPHPFALKEVRYTGGTMDTFRRPDGTWCMYDHVDGKMHRIGLQESGFVAGPDGIVFGATEVYREPYSGVL